MSKPLELTIFPPIERPRFGYGIDPYREQWKRERAIIESKRLIGAEVASEFWRISWATEIGGEEFEDQMEVLFRFATLPHYDEVNS